MSTKNKSAQIIGALLPLIITCIVAMTSAQATHAQEVEPKPNPSRTECNKVPKGVSSNFQLFRGFDGVTIGSNDRISFGYTDLDLVINTRSNTRITSVRFCVLGISGTYRINERGKRVMSYSYSYVWTTPINVTKVSKNEYRVARPLAGNNTYLYGGKGYQLFDYYDEQIAVFIDARGTGTSKLTVKPV